MTCQVAAFAELSEDRNPLHLDHEYASRSRFRKTIVHGALFSSLISALLGSVLPGEGTIFVRQQNQFKAPLPVGERVTAKVEVKSISKQMVTLQTSCVDVQGRVLLMGDVSVLAPKSVLPSMAAL